MKPQVSIVLPVYNAEKTLSFCLDSLMNLDFPKKNLEIIVVDNNSADATKDIIKLYPVRYAFENKRNRGAARNKGIKESRGELVAFIDADCVADMRWLTNIIRGFDSEAVGGCGGEIIPLEPQTLIEKYYSFRRYNSQKIGLMATDLFLPRIATGNAVYRRKILEEVGLFDDSFISNESVDLSWRVCLKGYQLNYVPEAIIYHKHPDKLSTFFRKWFEYGYTYTYLRQKYTNLIKGPLVGYDDWVEFFFKILQSTKALSITLFTRKDILEKTFPVLDIIKYTAFFGGRIYGLAKVKLRREKISLQPFLENKILWRTVNDETIIAILHKDCHYILNNVGSRIWTLLRDGKEIAEIIDIIADEYNIDKKKIKSDLVGFIAELKRENMLEI